MKTNRFLANFAPVRLTFVLVVWLFVAANGIRASVIAAPYCPQFCECGQDEKEVSWANCSRVLPERVQYPEVRRLTVVPDDGVALDENSVLHYIPLVFPRLKDLHVARCGLTHLSHSHFKQLGSLREIDLSGNRLTEISPHLFFSNQKLVYVNLENNPLKVRSGRPFLMSNSIVELDLSRCNLTVIAPDVFSALSALKYLRLGYNRLTTVHSRLLPMSLNALDLSHNLIRTVPIAELMELKELREIDLSGNPINCTCELIGFQNWISGQGVIFLNNIICSTPPKFYGWRLVDVPHYDLCEATLIESPTATLLSSSSSVESFDEDHISDNVIVPNARDLLSFRRNNRKRSSALDEGPDAIYENDEMLPVQKRANKRDSQNNPPLTEHDVEGSGDDSAELNTDSPEILAANSLPSVSKATEAAGKDEENSSTVATISAPTPAAEPEQSSPADVVVTAVAGSSVSPASSDTTVAESKSVTDETKINTTAAPQIENEGNRMKIGDVASSTGNLPPVEGPLSSTGNPPPEEGPLSSTGNPPPEEGPLSSTGNPPPEEGPISSTGNPPPEEGPISSTGNPPPEEGPISSTGNPPPEVSSTPPAEPSSTSTTENTESGIAEEPVAVKKANKAILNVAPSSTGDAEANTEKPTPGTIALSDAATVEQPAKPASNETDSYASGTNGTAEDSMTTTEVVNKTEGGDPFGQPHTGEQEKINVFGFGLPYIIPCVVVIAFMLVCVVVYASQRRKSFRKNWSLEDSRRQNEGGTELQDISLLSDAAKGNIVKRSKYPDETESEQTVRLMTPPSPDTADEQPNTASPAWQSDNLPPPPTTNNAPSNGQIPPSSVGSEQLDGVGGLLPNGETLPRTAPIAEPEDVNENDLQLTKAKVTVLQDSIPKTAVIINRNSTIDDAN